MSKKTTSVEDRVLMIVEDESSKTRKELQTLANSEDCIGHTKGDLKKLSFINDLGFDSLDTVNLVMELEDEFSIQIPDDDAEKIQTIEDAISYCAENKDPE